MTVTTTITETPKFILDYVDAVDRLAAKAMQAEAASRGRGWGLGEGEAVVYRGSSTIDDILDLRNLAEAGMMSGSIDVCEKFLASISNRPGVVTCAEIAKFCAEARDIATS